MKITAANNRLSPLESFYPVIVFCGGLSFRLRANEFESVALVDLDLLREENAVWLLSEQEQAYFHRFRYPKRRREWLGGRMAAKAALLTTHEPNEFQRLTILPDEYGRPAFSGITGLRRSLSISHSGRYAAALAVQGQDCGLDLQELSDKLYSLTDYFATSDELRILTDQLNFYDQETRLTMLWTVKEALKKRALSDKSMFFSGIKLKRISIVHNQVWQFHCTVQDCASKMVAVYNFSPYILALTEFKCERACL